MSGRTWREHTEGSDDVPRTSASTVRDDGPAPTALGGAHSELRLPAALARDWCIVSELANRGAEADLLVVANASGERRVAKIYRARVEPETGVLQSVGGTSFEHVVRLYDHGLSDDRWYELLEFIEAGSLEDLIRAEGPRLALPAVSEILWELTVRREVLAFEERRDALGAAGGPSPWDAVYRHASPALLLAVLPSDGTSYADTLRAQANDAVSLAAREAAWFYSLGNPFAAPPSGRF